MKISIIHPTRGRKIQALATAHKWMRKADRQNNIQYIFSVDNSDTDQWVDIINFTPQCFFNNGYEATVLKSDNKTAIEAINNAAKIATGDLLIVVSDDFDCPEHWDSLLLLAGLPTMSDFIIKTKDGIQPTLITLPIMDRVYYNRFGYIYHPDYLHMHADEEMTIVGHMLGRVINVDLEFKHNHYSVGGMKMDAINQKNNATWSHGQTTLNRRAKDNFGIANPVCKIEDIQWR
jgi:hypothetical protein